MQGRAATKDMTTLVTITDHRPSLSPAGLEDKPADTRRQQLASKPMELVRVGQSATAKGIKLASNAATVTVGKTKVALVPPTAAIPPQRDSTMPRKRLQRATRRTPVTRPQPNREAPASNAAIASVGKTKVAWVPLSTAAAAVAVQPAAATQAAKARPPAPQLRKALPPGVRKSRAAKPAVTRAAHHNLFDAVGAPVSAAPRSAAAQSTGGLAGGPGPGAAKVEDGMTEEWFESVAETATPYSLNLQQHRKLQELFIEHVARLWFHKCAPAAYRDVVSKKPLVHVIYLSAINLPRHCKRSCPWYAAQLNAPSFDRTGALSVLCPQHKSYSSLSSCQETNTGPSAL